MGLEWWWVHWSTRGLWNATYALHMKLHLNDAITSSLEFKKKTRGSSRKPIVMTEDRGPVTLRRGLLKTGVSLRQSTQCFPFTLWRRNLKPQQLPVSLYFYLSKTRTGKSHNYCNVVIFEKFSFKCSLSTRKRQDGVFKFLQPVWRGYSQSFVFAMD